MNPSIDWVQFWACQRTFFIQFLDIGRGKDIKSKHCQPNCPQNKTTFSYSHFSFLFSSEYKIIYMLNPIKPLFSLKYYSDWFRLVLLVSGQSSRPEFLVPSPLDLEILVNNPSYDFKLSHSTNNNTTTIRWWGSRNKLFQKSRRKGNPNNQIDK